MEKLLSVAMVKLQWDKMLFSKKAKKEVMFFYFLMVTFFVALHAEMSSFCPFPSMVYARTRT